MKTIEQFCSDHNACPEGRDWALANCKDMLEAWSTAKPTWVIWIATRPGVLTEREIKIFAVWCAKQVRPLITKPDIVKALDTVERYVEGKATEEELAWARHAACAVPETDFKSAYRTVASAIVCVSVFDWEVPETLKGVLYDLSAVVEDRDASKTAQAEWLRNNTQPNFN